MLYPTRWSLKWICPCWLDSPCLQEIPTPPRSTQRLGNTFVPGRRANLVSRDTFISSFRASHTNVTFLRVAPRESENGIKIWLSETYTLLGGILETKIELRFICNWIYLEEERGGWQFFSSSGIGSACLEASWWCSSWLGRSLLCSSWCLGPWLCVSCIYSSCLWLSWLLFALAAASLVVASATPPSPHPMVKEHLPRLGAGAADAEIVLNRVWRHLYTCWIGFAACTRLVSAVPAAPPSPRSGWGVERTAAPARGRSSWCRDGAETCLRHKGWSGKSPAVARQQIYMSFRVGVGLHRCCCEFSRPVKRRDR